MNDKKCFRKKCVLLILLAILIVQNTRYLQRKSERNEYQSMQLEDDTYRSQFASPEMLAHEEQLPDTCRSLLRNILRETRYYPVPESTKDKTLKTTYENSWMFQRTYGGTRGHEGIDLMATKNERGIYPILSMTDGVVTNLGWLEKGGYRIGITTESGTYYYYAHLDSYANLREGDEVSAGEFLGYMGDSGYGSEGTKGKFEVHLHLGIYSYLEGKEISLNPYYVLKLLEDQKLKYAFTSQGGDVR